MYSTTEGPIRLMLRGKMPQKSRPHLSVVGARRMTEYGEMIVESIVKPLAKKRVVIVSGFMYGVDVTAHRVTLREQGCTIAVLGSGLDVPFPNNQEELYTAILENGGAVVSPFAPHDKAKRWMFPQRNKIVAALSNATLVIEAAEKSGSLITAQYAEEYGKVVMAVPGSLFAPMSAGTNALIRSGAMLVRNAVDVAEVLGIDVEKTKAENMLGIDAFTVDELSRKMKKPVQELLPFLTQLVMDDQLIEKGGKYYAR